MTATTVNTAGSAEAAGAASPKDQEKKQEKKPADPLRPAGRGPGRGRGRLATTPPLPDATCLEVWGRSVLSSQEGYDEDGIESHILRGTD